MPRVCFFLSPEVFVTMWCLGRLRGARVEAHAAGVQGVGCGARDLGRMCGRVRDLRPPVWGEAARLRIPDPEHRLPPPGREFRR